MSENECQHCHQEVEWDQETWSWIHTGTGRVQCISTAPAPAIYRPNDA